MSTSNHSIFEKNQKRRIPLSLQIPKRRGCAIRETCRAIESGLLTAGPQARFYERLDQGEIWDVSVGLILQQVARAYAGVRADTIEFTEQLNARSACRGDRLKRLATLHLVILDLSRGGRTGLTRLPGGGLIGRLALCLYPTAAIVAGALAITLDVLAAITTAGGRTTECSSASRLL